MLEHHRPPALADAEGARDRVRSQRLRGWGIVTDRPRPAATAPAPDDLPEQMRVRREKRQRLVESGRAPYPNEVRRTHSLTALRAAYDPRDLPPDTHTGDVVTIAGRVIHLRNTGKLCFV